MALNTDKDLQQYSYSKTTGLSTINGELYVGDIHFRESLPALSELSNSLYESGIPSMLIDVFESSNVDGLASGLYFVANTRPDFSFEDDTPFYIREAREKRDPSLIYLDEFVRKVCTDKNISYGNDSLVRDLDDYRTANEVAFKIMKETGIKRPYCMDLEFMNYMKDLYIALKEDPENQDYLKEKEDIYNEIKEAWIKSNRLSLTMSDGRGSYYDKNNNGNLSVFIDHNILKNFLKDVRLMDPTIDFLYSEDVEPGFVYLSINPADKLIVQEALAQATCETYEELSAYYGNEIDYFTDKGFNTEHYIMPLTDLVISMQLLQTYGTDLNVLRPSFANDECELGSVVVQMSPYARETYDTRVLPEIESYRKMVDSKNDLLSEKERAELKAKFRKEVPLDIQKKIAINKATSIPLGRKEVMQEWVGR